MNQTTQMHQISEHLPEYEHSFSPYYCDHSTEILRRLGLIEFTIAGNKLAGRCRGYLRDHRLPIDCQGKSRPYDLVVTTRTRISSAPPERSTGTRRMPWCSRLAARKR